MHVFAPCLSLPPRGLSAGAGLRFSPRKPTVLQVYILIKLFNNIFLSPVDFPKNRSGAVRILHHSS